MTENERVTFQNAILGMRRNNPMELKTRHCAEFTFTTFYELIKNDGYTGTKEVALTWWNNQRNPQDN